MAEITPAGSENGSSNPAKHFGRQVRKARREHGWSLRDLSARTGLSPGHLSLIENGKRGITEYVAGKMDAVFTERRGWFSEYHRDSREWAPPGYRSWAEYENAARSLRTWTPGVLDGLVQTEAYARTQLETVRDVPPEVIEARLAARMERQRRILQREDPPAAWVLVDEMALYRLTGSPELMTEQLDHLLGIAGLPDVTVHVVPGVMHAVTVSELIVTDGAAYCEHIAGGFVYTDAETVTSLGRMITNIQADSYRASESVQLIERVRDIWSRGVNPLTALRAEHPASK